MSDTPYTRGPLTVRLSSKWPFHVETVDQNGQVVFSEDLVCSSTSHQTREDAIECRGFTRESRRSARALIQRQLANAYLRAAAPELLEALEAADRAVNNAIGSEQLSDQGIHGKAARLNDKVWEWRKMREAALKKARGEK